MQSTACNGDESVGEAVIDGFQENIPLLTAFVKAAPLQASGVAGSASFIDLCRAVFVQMPQCKIVDVLVLQMCKTDHVLGHAPAPGALLSVHHHNIQGV